VEVEAERMDRTTGELHTLKRFQTRQQLEEQLVQTRQHMASIHRVLNETDIVAAGLKAREAEAVRRQQVITRQLSRYQKPDGQLTPEALEGLKRQAQEAAASLEHSLAIVSQTHDLRLALEREVAALRDHVIHTLNRTSDYVFFGGKESSEVSRMHIGNVQEILHLDERIRRLRDRLLDGIPQAKYDMLSPDELERIARKNAQSNPHNKDPVSKLKAKLDAMREALVQSNLENKQLILTMHRKARRKVKGDKDPLRPTIKPATTVYDREHPELTLKQGGSSKHAPEFAHPVRMALLKSVDANVEPPRQHPIPKILSESSLNNKSSSSESSRKQPLH